MTPADQLYRIVPLPEFPAVSEDGETPPPDPFSPNALLGGFLAGPENRYAELAVRLANDGVPIFARPLGETPGLFDKLGATDRFGASVSPFFGKANENDGPSASRADVEILFRSVADGSLSGERLDAFFQRADAETSGPSLISEKSERSKNAPTSPFPPVVGRRSLEDANFLTPLVLYGPSGSGKTRIVEGICQRRRLREPNKTLYYLSGVDFFEALVNAIRRDQTTIFRRLFSQADVVAVENADIFAEREAAQLEFLQILDESIKKRKLVVLTFSKIPSDIPGLYPELSARLCGGLLIPTRFPTRGTKKFAISQVAARLRLRLSDDALDFCVDRLPASVGGICAALVQAAREIPTFAVPATAERIAAFLEKRNPTPEWTIDKILKTVAKYFSVSIVETRSEKRSKTLVLVRSFVFFLARKLTNATLQEIGREFSNREHSTVLKGIRDLETALETDETLQKNLRELVARLRAEDFFDFNEY